MEKDGKLRADEGEEEQEVGGRFFGVHLSIIWQQGPKENVKIPKKRPSPRYFQQM